MIRWTLPHNPRMQRKRPPSPHLTHTPLAAATVEVLPSLAMLLYQISWERKGAGETVPPYFAVFLSHRPAVLVHCCRRHRRFRHCHCIHVSASCSKWMLVWNATCLFRGTVCSCVQSHSLQLRSVTLCSCVRSLSAVMFLCGGLAVCTELSCCVFESVTFFSVMVHVPDLIVCLLVSWHFVYGVYILFTIYLFYRFQYSVLE